MHPTRRFLVYSASPLFRRARSLTAVTRRIGAVECTGITLWRIPRRNKQYFSETDDWFVEDYHTHPGDPGGVTTLYEGKWKRWLVLLGVIAALGIYPFWIFWLKYLYFPRVEVFRLIEKDEVGNNIISHEIHVVTSHGFSREFPECISRQIVNVHPTVVFLDVGLQCDQLKELTNQFNVTEYHRRALEYIAADASAEQAEFHERFMKRLTAMQEGYDNPSEFHRLSDPAMEVSERMRHKYETSYFDELVMWLGQNLKGIMEWNLTKKIQEELDCSVGLDAVSVAEACVVYQKKLLLGDSADLFLPYCDTNPKSIYVVDFWKKKELKHYLQSRGYISLGVWSRYVGRGH